MRQDAQNQSRRRVQFRTIVALLMLATMHSGAFASRTAPLAEEITRWTPAETLSRALYAVAAKLGLVRGSWMERKRLERGFAAFVAQDERAVREWAEASPNFSEPVFEELRDALLAVSLAQGGDPDGADEVLREATSAAVGPAASRRLRELRTVLLHDRTDWSEVQPLCHSVDARSQGHLVDVEELLYRCVMIASRSGDWEAAKDLAERLPVGSDFHPYALYAAGVAAARAGESGTAAAAMRRVARNLEVLLQSRPEAEGRSIAPLWPAERRLLEKRGLAALVAVYDLAGSRQKAIKTLAKISPSTVEYGMALAAIVEREPLEIGDFARLLSGQSEKFSAHVNLMLGSALLRAGLSEFATPILERAVAQMRQAESARSLPARAKWSSCVIDIERRLLAREAIWRAALVVRARRFVGAFFNEPLPPRSREVRERFEDVERLTAEDRSLAESLAAYVAREEVRRPVRGCLRGRADGTACERAADKAYEKVVHDLRGRWRQELFEAERLLGDALVFASSK